MGIVAFCPQGHRVKVKDHLAGRKGICPECGTRFRIPLESAAAPQAAAGMPEPDAAAEIPGPPPVAGGNRDGVPERISPTGTPIARIVSLDSELAASLPRAIPLAAPEGGG